MTGPIDELGTDRIEDEILVTSTLNGDVIRCPCERNHGVEWLPTVDALRQRRLHHPFHLPPSFATVTQHRLHHPSPSDALGQRHLRHHSICHCQKFGSDRLSPVTSPPPPTPSAKSVTMRSYFPSVFFRSSIHGLDIPLVSLSAAATLRLQCTFLSPLSAPDFFPLCPPRVQSRLLPPL